MQVTIFSLNHRYVPLLHTVQLQKGFTTSPTFSLQETSTPWLPGTSYFCKVLIQKQDFLNEIVLPLQDPILAGSLQKGNSTITLSFGHATCIWGCLWIARQSTAIVSVHTYQQCGWNKQYLSQIPAQIWVRKQKRDASTWHQSDTASAQRLL